MLVDVEVVGLGVVGFFFNVVKKVLMSKGFVERPIIISYHSLFKHQVLPAVHEDA